MIVGEVTTSRDIRIRIAVRGPSGREAEITSVVDTGFTEHLTLSAHLLNDLYAEKVDAGTVRLADGSSVAFDIYRVWVEWNGNWLEIPAYAAEGGSLVGMALLYGNDLTIRVVEGGAVTITPFSN